MWHFCHEYTIKKSFASDAEKRAIKRRFQQAGADQRSALDNFLQPLKRDESLSTKPEDDSDIKLPSTPEHVLTEPELDEAHPAAVVAGSTAQQPRDTAVSDLIVNDPALWTVDNATVDYWICAGPSTCRHRNGVYKNSVRKPEKGSARQLRDTAFSTVSPNGETVMGNGWQNLALVLPVNWEGVLFCMQGPHS